MAGVSPFLSVITLKVNSLIKCRNWQNRLKKNDRSKCSLQEIHFRCKDTKEVKRKRKKKYSMKIVAKRDLEWLYYYQTKQILSQKKVILRRYYSGS